MHPPASTTATHHNSDHTLTAHTIDDLNTIIDQLATLGINTTTLTNLRTELHTAHTTDTNNPDTVHGRHARRTYNLIRATLEHATRITTTAPTDPHTLHGLLRISAPHNHTPLAELIRAIGKHTTHPITNPTENITALAHILRSPNGHAYDQHRYTGHDQRTNSTDGTTALAARNHLTTHPPHHHTTATTHRYVGIVNTGGTDINGGSIYPTPFTVLAANDPHLADNHHPLNDTTSLVWFDAALEPHIAATLLPHQLHDAGNHPDIWATFLTLCDDAHAHHTGPLYLGAHLHTHSLRHLHTTAHALHT
jgi:hypothetical protein